MRNTEVKSPTGATPWAFVLYTTGNLPAGQTAEAMLRRLCDRYLPGRFTIRIIDVEKEMEDVPPDILALPTVVRKSPLPERRVIGDLSAREAAIKGLELEIVG
jgi:circadian clock protein KaiB